MSLTFFLTASFKSLTVAEFITATSASNTSNQQPLMILKLNIESEASIILYQKMCRLI
ncbi:hypothetical protein HanIR_Chr12g0580361 [Helianthus annuus]|nr:hypothetical protein HanIR_Chr12g0580361 [Helianthus annuus]